MKAFLTLLKQDSQYLIERVIVFWRKVSDVQGNLYRLQFTEKKQISFIKEFNKKLAFASPKQVCDVIIMGVERSGDDQLKKVVSVSILNALQAGKKTSFGMEPWFNRELMNVYHAGEQSNQVVDIIDIYIKQKENSGQFSKDLFKGLVPPLYIISGMLALAFYLSSSDYMGLANIKPVNQWPMNAQEMHELVTMIVGYWPLTLGSISGLVFLFMTTSKGMVNNLRFWLDEHLFPFKIYKAFVAIRVFKMLAVLKIAGEKDLDAINAVHFNEGRYVQYFTKQMRKNVKDGVKNFGDVIDVGLFPPRMVSLLIGAYESPEAAVKNEAIRQVNDDADEEIELMLGRSKLIAPIIAWVTAAYLAMTMLEGLGELVLTMNA